MRCLAFLAIIGLTSIPASAFAQAQGERPSACAYAPTILAAADFLLTEPAVKPNFWHDRAGDDAAYLTIHYGKLTYAEGSELLAALERRSHPPQRVMELRLAYAKTSRRTALIAEIPSNSNHGSILPELGESVWRVLVLEDGGDWLFGELARWQAADPDQFDRSIVTLKLAEALADFDDDAKSRLAKRAEDAGAWKLALNLLALKENLADYLSYVDRLPVTADPTNLSNAPDRRERWILHALHLNDFRPSFDISIQPAEAQAIDRQRPIGRVVRSLGQLVARAPEAALLTTVLNQSGELGLGTVIAATLNAQIEAKQLDPTNEPDALITAMVYGLDYVLGRRNREDILGNFGLSGMQGETAGEFVDRALARFALAPFVRNETASPPNRPATITAAFPWEQWVGLAGRLRASEPIVPGDRIVAAELLIAADRPFDALAFLKTASDSKTALLRTHGLMRALDRRCGNLLSHPVPTAEPLYRFGPR